MPDAGLVERVRVGQKRTEPDWWKMKRLFGWAKTGKQGAVLEPSQALSKRRRGASWPWSGRSAGLPGALMTKAGLLRQVGGRDWSGPACQFRPGKGDDAREPFAVKFSR